MVKQKCRKCNKRKSLSSFHKNSRNPNGLQTSCKSCRSAYDSARLKKLASRKRIIRPTSKMCFECRNVLPASEFYKTPYHRDGLYSICKPCRRSRMSRNYAKSASGPEGLARIVFCSIRQRSRRRGWSDHLTMQQVCDLLTSSRNCSLTGLRLRWSSDPKDPLAPSIDRIDSSLGYVVKNCRLVAYCVNIALSDFGDEVFDKMCRRYVSFCRSKKRRS